MTRMMLISINVPNDKKRHELHPKHSTDGPTWHDVCDILTWIDKR